MTAAAAVKRPPTVYTEVEIDPDELHEQGWIYVGGKGLDSVDEAVEQLEELHRLITAQHDADHDGPMRWCQHELCREVSQ